MEEIEAKNLEYDEEFAKIGEECKKSRGSTENMETNYIALKSIGFYRVVYTSAILTWVYDKIIFLGTMKDNVSVLTIMYSRAFLFSKRIQSFLAQAGKLNVRFGS